MTRLLDLAPRTWRLVVVLILLAGMAVGLLGLSFGGGCFYAHGTYVTGWLGELRVGRDDGGLMAYFEDLTPYTYGQPPEPDVLNVGWLSNEHAFQTGTVPGLAEAVAELVRTSRVNEYRGYHRCDLCWDPSQMGNGEIRVKDAIGQVYAAPVLIAHYIEAHQYLPPQGFIDAVLHGEVLREDTQ